MRPERYQRHETRNQFQARMESESDRMVNPRYSVEEIVEVARSFSTTDLLHHANPQIFLFSVVAKRLWDRDVPARAALAVATRMNPSRLLGNSLAEEGKDLAQDDDLSNRTKPVLRLATDVFRRVWDQEKEAGTLDEGLLIDFKRVADLQMDAGDDDGARTTAKILTPLIIEYETTHVFKDDFERESLDSIKESLLGILRDPEDPIFQQLYETIKPGKVKASVDAQILSGRAMVLIEEGNIMEALNLVNNSEAEKFPFSLQIARWMTRKIDEGKTEDARQLFNQYIAFFPDKFTGSQSFKFTFQSYIYILAKLEKYTLLADMIMAIGNENKDHQTTPQEIAFKAGKVFAQLHPESDGNGFVQFRELLPEQLATSAQEAFDMERDQQKNTASVPSDEE